jgi:hypothetical protein
MVQHKVHKVHTVHNGLLKSGSLACLLKKNLVDFVDFVDFVLNHACV